MIINAGSENKVGDLKQAKRNAKKWINSIHSEGFLEVEMKFIEEYKGKYKGMFLFNFEHSVTKKVATLETHGFTDKECKEFMFYPRTYWNGCSTSDPKIEDWLPDDFKYRIEYYRSSDSA